MIGQSKTHGPACLDRGLLFANREDDIIIPGGFWISDDSVNPISEANLLNGVSLLRFFATSYTPL